MSVSPASSRAGRHASQSAGPGRPPGVLRRAAASNGTPSLTVTLSIPLIGTEELTPAARRLLDAALEMLERGEGTVSGLPVGNDRRVEPAPQRDLAGTREPANVREQAGTRAPALATVATGGPALHILAASRSVLLEGSALPLTRLEFDLLMHLVAHPRRVFTRLQLLNSVWGYEHTGVRTVDVHVRRLRGKVGTDVPLVTTVYGVGYRLADEALITIDRNG